MIPRCRPFKLAIFLAAVSLWAAAPVPLIFDTDIGNDIDDTLALAMIHALESRGEARLLAVTVSKDNPFAGPFVDLIDTFYKRPGVPVGTVRNGKTTDDGNYLRSVIESGLYPHALDDGQKAPEAVILLRKILASRNDRSVVLVQVGFSTNLARLVESKPDQSSLLPGRELMRAKIRLICVMAGQFPSGKPEYNVKTDVDSARELFTDSPVPIVFSGYELGARILYPAASIQRDFAYVPHHPVADAYRSYMKMPYDRPTWDLTAVLFAVRPNTSFGLSPPGNVHVDPDGKTSFTPEKSGPHRYLTATPEQARAALAQMIELSTAPPGRE